ncbi:DNA mismatch repair protein MutS [Psychrobacillus psychrodurans]|uniref:DNA mismatch repair protein MutS n=1 Tax=Psychrobacillus psychrodurans TaxID=126157 RepID=UPI0008F1DD9F|nr:DNA mismatch repair protein MutS [Psychrobacillus psychrodurans]MCZ8540182.1 DNA mismatch repair protein MutS [Psychrobacillus psychrodurans]SFM48354.1 DNA mismatch repair protein MutS [Psychrobacillus psychrodurans]
MTTQTPMMQQYLKIKEDHIDAFLFFRLGDFYELFHDDAIKAAAILEITLTSRKDNIPMCGVPHHSAQGYIETLISKGYKVAICEQVEDPKHAKGVVKREVVRLVTPGTIIEGKAMQTKSNYFIASADLLAATNEVAFAYLDVSTGDGFTTILTGDEKEVVQELLAIQAKELIVSEQMYVLINELSAIHDFTVSIEKDELSNEDIHKYIPNHPDQTHQTVKRLLQYIQKTQKQSLLHIQPFTFQQRESFLAMDYHSKRNLELISSIRSGDQKGTLLWLLDETVTAMGGRKLKQWIHQPLANRQSIEARQEIVTSFLNDFMLREEIKEAFKEVYDLERLVGRIGFGSAGGRDLAQLRQSLSKVPIIKQLLVESEDQELQRLGNALEDCEVIWRKLQEAISENPPISVKDGGVINNGFHERLDQLRDASVNGKKWIAELEQREREITGSKNLKIGYNRIFGYYIELTKSNIHLADESRYVRKQTLANAERYITDELKEKESLILSAEDESLVLEYELFMQVREEIKTYIPLVQKLAKQISELDVFISFAQVAENHRLTKPVFHDSNAMIIKEGRHPVVEKMMNNQLYVPNDCVLTEDINMLLITGPNMSGKSTFMRQIAITTVMAQIGCYVPAESATLPIVDKIFTRIGAADDLAGGQSTFMIEMMESQHAIMNATSKSLLLFDEIGRGTSTYDGMSLAQAMMEYIHENIGANTLFSTHYHELTDLEDSLPKLRNVHVSATEKDGKVVFLHKLKDGPADKSYGIHVAELAQLPEQIISRARDILATFEDQEEKGGSAVQVSETQLSFFDEQPKTRKEPVVIQDDKSTDKIIKKLKKVNISGTTPLEALQLLYELQNELE